MIRTAKDDILILEWHDNITLKNIDQFRQEVVNFLSRDNTKLILNLSNTMYINSAGLGIIAENVIQSRKNQKKLVLAEISESVKEIFSIVKFASFIKIFDTEVQAIEFFAPNE